jgi:hypothetical protein
MADQSKDLIDLVNTYKAAAEFQPCAYYGPEEDALMFYFRSDPDYAKRINSRVTVYLSMDDHELVGCQIKGVRRVLEELDELGLTIKHGAIKLHIVLLAIMDQMVEQEETREVYREVFKKAKETDVEFERPELAAI